MIILLQLDPAPYAVFGIWAVLAFVIVLLGALLYHLVTKQSANFQSREEQFMNFIGSHTDKTTSAARENVDKTNAAIKEVSANMREGLTEIKTVISQHTDKLNTIYLMNEVSRRIEAGKRRGDQLDDTMVEKIVKTVIQEQRGK